TWSMSKPRRDISFLADIEEAIQHIFDYTEGFLYEDFLEEDMVKDAVLRNIQIIGEATKKLTESLRQRYAHTPWREMAGMRDKVVHDYFEVDYAVVWDVIQQDLPGLLPQIQAILKDLEEEEG
ncbi:MAG: DUF86 domain-containing protein, partial [Candidatus Moraniibacteriota bacterium]